MTDDDELDEITPTQQVERLTPRKRMIAAAKLKIDGASNEEIAEILNYENAAEAQKAIDTAIASTVDPATDFQSLRRLANARLEASMRALAPKALHATVVVEETRDGKTVKVRKPNAEHLAANQQWLRNMDSWMRLHGVNAPQVLTVITPDAKELEQLVSDLVQLTRADGEQEADLFEEDQDGIFIEAERKREEEAAAAAEPVDAEEVTDDDPQ